MAYKKLVRSANNKVWAGVLGGLAEFWEIDPTLVRVGYTALTIFSTGFPGLLLYILMALMIPKGGKNDGFEDAEVVD